MTSSLSQINDEKINKERAKEKWPQARERDARSRAKSFKEKLDKYKVKVCVAMKRKFAL